MKNFIEYFKTIINQKHIKSNDLKNSDEILQLLSTFENSQETKKFDIGRKLYLRLKHTGNLSHSIKILEELIRLESKKKFLYRELNINKEKLDLFNEYVHIVSQEQENALSRSYKIHQYKKILHVLNTSVPYLNNGYSMRSKYIVENQKKYGFEPMVITRPGFPNDFFKDLIVDSKNIYAETINGIVYYRPLPDKFMRYTPIKQYISIFSQIIQSIIDEHSPDIIHAASNYVIGLAALEAAKQKNKPFIYEIRGFWELTKASKEPFFMDSEEFKLTQIMETYLAHKAAKVIVISNQLKHELLKRKINDEKIHIAPNGVDCNYFKPLKHNQPLSNKYNTTGNFTIGYIGSIIKYEGLQILLEAVAKLKAEGYKDIKVIIVGDGEYRSTLEELTKELGLNGFILFTGKVSHDVVIQYYSLFDICVYPRIQEEVTNMVTPLKPLEAMACGKAVIGSNVAGIREIIIPRINGLIFNNTVDDLCNKIEILYRNNKLKRKLGSQARKWVEENRNWSKLITLYENIYKDLVKKR